jgi:hypothetical protein
MEARLAEQQAADSWMRNTDLLAVRAGRGWRLSNGDANGCTQTPTPPPASPSQELKSLSARIKQHADDLRRQSATSAQGPNNSTFLPEVMTRGVARDAHYYPQRLVLHDADVQVSLDEPRTRTSSSTSPTKRRSSDARQQQQQPPPPTAENPQPRQPAPTAVARRSAANPPSYADVTQDTLNLSMAAMAAIDTVGVHTAVPEEAMSPFMYELKTLHRIEHGEQASRVEGEVRNLVDLGLVHQDEELAMHLAEEEGRPDEVLARIEACHDPLLVDAVAEHTANRVRNRGLPLPPATRRLQGSGSLAPPSPLGTGSRAEHALNSPALTRRSHVSFADTAEQLHDTLVARSRLAGRHHAGGRQRRRQFGAVQ